MNYAQLQYDVEEWSNQQPFGDQDEFRPLVGAYEELGEIYDAITVQQLEDAIGDTVIYLADFCARDGSLLLSSPLSYQYERDVMDEIFYQMGKLSHSHLKRDQGIRTDEYGVSVDFEQEVLSRILYLLDNLAVENGTTIERSIETAWGEVNERDWNEDPNSG